MSTHNLCFEQKYEKYQSFYLKIFCFFFFFFFFFEVTFSIHLNKSVFVMDLTNPLQHLPKENHD